MQRQNSLHSRPFHWTLTYILDFTEKEIAKYTSFRSVLHILSPGNNIFFNRNNPSISKCWYGILLFRSFRLTTGCFPWSTIYLSLLYTIYLSLIKKLINWSSLGSETAMAPFRNMSWNSWSTGSTATLVKWHKPSSFDCLCSKIKTVLTSYYTQDHWIVCRFLPIFYKMFHYVCTGQLLDFYWK